MSDIPPASEESYLGPQENPPIAHHQRGIRGRNAAKRKRLAYIRNVVKFSDITDAALVPVIHSGGQQRSLYTTRD